MEKPCRLNISQFVAYCSQIRLFIPSPTLELDYICQSLFSARLSILPTLENMHT